MDFTAASSIGIKSLQSLFSQVSSFKANVSRSVSNVRAIKSKPTAAFDSVRQSFKDTVSSSRIDTKA